MIQHFARKSQEPQSIRHCATKLIHAKQQQRCAKKHVVVPRTKFPIQHTRAGQTITPNQIQNL